MFFIFGFIMVTVCVLGAYSAHGGYLGILWQPLEFVIIFGSGIGAYIIANPMPVMKGTGAGMKMMFTGTPYSKKDAYFQVIGFFFELSKAMRTKGIKEVEQHIDNPHESALFQKYPLLEKDHHLNEFICDNVRLIVMGSGAPHQLEELMDQELEQHHHERHLASSSIATLADGLPALGIVAAVLGIIYTMGSITEPPEVLGHLIGVALVGTFSGVLFSYGYVAPMAKNMETSFEHEAAVYKCCKVGILNFARQQSPQMIAEFIRKHVPNAVKPGFTEVEEYLNGIGS